MKTGKCPGGDKRHVGGRHQDVVVEAGMGQLKWHHHLGSFQHFEQLALHAQASDVLGGPGAGKHGVVLPGCDLVELVQAHDADGSQQRIVVGCMQKAGENRAWVLSHVASFRIGGDIDDHSGQVQDLLEQQFDQKGLAAPGGSDEQGIGFGQKVFALDPVDVDALDAADVAVGHERYRPARLVLSAVAEFLKPPVDLTRRQHRKFLGEPDQVLKTGPPRLLELFHRFSRLAQGGLVGAAVVLCTHSEPVRLPLVENGFTLVCRWPRHAHA